MQTSSTNNITGKTVSGDTNSIVGNYEKLLLVGDTNNDKTLSSYEKEIMSKFIDVNGDKKVSQTELDIVSYIASKDKTNGLSSKESDILMLLKHLAKEAGVTITPQNLTKLKIGVDTLDRQYNEPKWQNLITQLNNPKARDLDGNKQIDPWEKHLGELGISTSAEKLKSFTSAADSNKDGKVSEAEYNAIKGYLDLNGDKKIGLNELKFLDFVTKLDGTAGLGEKEMTAYKDVKKAVDEHQAINGTLPLNDKNLEIATNKAKDAFNTHDFASKEGVDLDKNGKIEQWEIDIAKQGISISLEKLKLLTSIADSDKDGKVSEAEYNAIKDYLDLNGDKQVNLNELKFLDSVTKLDGTAGLGEKEITAYKDVKKAVDEHQAKYGTLPLSDKNLEIAINIAKDAFNTHSFASKEGVDLDKNGKIEQWEIDIAKQGISTPETLALLTSIADSNKDGKVSEAEYNAIKDYLDLNGDKQVTLNELKFLDSVTKLDGAAGLGEKEMTAYKDVKKAVDEYQATNGTLPLNDNNLETAINIAKDAFNTHGFAPKEGVDLDKNGKIDDFEKNAATQYGINQQSTSIEQMVKIADANADGKVSEAEFQNISKYIDLNGNKKADKLELDLLEALSSFDGKNGIGSVEAMLADYYLAQDDNKITDVFLSEEIKWLKDNKTA